MWTATRIFLGQVVLLLTIPLFWLAILLLDGWQAAKKEAAAIWSDLRHWKRWVR